MDLIWADYAILIIVALSMIISLIRGFVREALSLAGWIIAGWVALTFMPGLATMIEPYISVPSVRSIAAFAILFIVTLILAALFNNLVVRVVDATGLTGTDRAIGMLFGVARGIVIVGFIVLLAGFTAVPNDPWWHQAQLLPHFQQLALWMRDFLPADFASRLHY